MLSLCPNLVYNRGTMPRTSEIKLREDPEIKRKAATIFRAFGMDTSTAIRMFLRQVVRTKSIPFRMESGYTAAGERAILEAEQQLEEDIRAGQAKEYTSTKELLDDLVRKK